MSRWLRSVGFLISITCLSAETTRVYRSPDRALLAVVETTSMGESKTAIRLSSGRLLLIRDERSTDGAHGQGVEHAMWTADSLFLVVNTSASGGHQPWARPMWIFSRATGRIVELSQLGVNATVDFTLRNPDTLETRINVPTALIEVSRSAYVDYRRAFCRYHLVLADDCPGPAESSASIWSLPNVRWLLSSA